jgi:uncharacterized coiled-coil protein SlyX|tara:strand:- start:1447 stop:1686 length:240 start_codon:yes stop_codon:yes gene_type:complete
MNDVTENLRIELETRIMDLEKQVQELSDVVSDQWKIVDALKGGLVKQQGRIVALESGKEKGAGERSLIDEARENIPPHY